MSLSGALQIGRSALGVSQAALQVAGNNMANAATEGYSRRTVHLAPLRGQVVGADQVIGRGVGLLAIRRATDGPLQARLRDAMSDEQALVMDRRFLDAMESVHAELTDGDLSTLLSSFFNAFSEAANTPTDGGLRSLVVEEGAAVAARIGDLRSSYEQMRGEIDASLADSVRVLNERLDQIAALNVQVAQTNGSGGDAGSVEDQRDVLIDEVAGLVDVSVVRQASGVADVFIGSIPVVTGSVNRGVRIDVAGDDGDLDVRLRLEDDGTFLESSSGSIGGMIRQRSETVVDQIRALDDFAGALVRSVNALHAQGQGLHGRAEVTGTVRVQDTTAALNALDAEVPFDVSNGSFELHLTSAAGGIRTGHRVDVDGSMSLQDLVDEINTVMAIPSVTASITPEGQLRLTADDGYTLSFADDDAGVLTALGVNGFFTGSDASDIGIDAALREDPALLALGADHVEGSNGTAVAIAGLQDQPLEELSGRNLREFWRDRIGSLGLRTEAAGRSVDAAALVRESLDAQLQSVTGVSLDEESVNLITFQRQYQASARYITVVDEMLQTLLSIA